MPFKVLRFDFKSPLFRTYRHYRKNLMVDEYTDRYVNGLIERSSKFDKDINFNRKYLNLENSISDVIKKRNNENSKIKAEIHEHAINTRILCHPLVFK